jgi:hypothetical protein
MNNLQLYHKVFQQLSQWLPEERVTRLRNGVLLIAGLYLSGAVHLPHIVREWPLPGKAPSLSNRLRRFLDNRRVKVEEWYHPLVSQMMNRLAGQTIRLIVGCSQVGRHHRALMVGIAYRKRALPVAWRVYRGSKGHIGHPQTIALLKHVRRLLPAQCMVELVADAGFESVGLLAWLSRQHWHFAIHLSGRTKVTWRGQSWLKLNQIMIQEGQTLPIGWVRVAESHNYGWVWLLAHWAKGEEEPWYLVSNRAASSVQLIRMYQRRMWIEETFGDFKGHGFDLEATRLDDPQRIERLMLGICIVFVCLIALGSWLVKRGFRHLIDLKSRRDKSYFRLGWDWLARFLRLQQPLPFGFALY